MRDAQPRGVGVRLVERRGDGLARGSCVRDVPAATPRLPSAALGDRGGGSIVTDPADKEGLHTAEPVVLIDLGCRPT